MCTVSWLRTETGYELCFNRDELDSRATEEPAAVRELEAGPYLAPRDPDGGGTWLGVAPSGWTLCLLNGDGPGGEPPTAGWSTRGQLIPDLLHDPLARIERMSGGGLRAFRPFMLHGMSPDGVAQAWRWDGEVLGSLAVPAPHGPLTSSGVDPVTTQARREALLREHLTRLGASRAALLAFHRVLGDGTDAGLGHGPCVRRRDVSTRSLCHVVVDLERVSVSHALGPPDRTPLASPVSLPRAHP